MLVTGGAGYIGSHAAKALSAAGHDVVIFDNLTAGHRGAAEAVAGGARGGRVSLVTGDIRDTPLVARTLRETGARAVMHFAALLSVGESVRDPLGYYDNNVRGALSVLEAMVREGAPHFIFSSTAAVFGHPIETPITETHPRAPINAYGETKLAIERALPHFERAYGVRSMRLRYFNAAGADPDGELGEDHDPEIHLIPRAIDAAHGGAPLQVFGDDYDTPDGTCLRDYIHVTDLADAHVRALGALEAGGASDVFNLGNGRPYSVREVIDTVAAVTGRPVPHTMAPRRPGDPAVLFASSEKIARALGWSARFADVRVIVQHAWQWRVARPRGFAAPAL